MKEVALPEHAGHVGHRRDVPGVEGLVEGVGEIGEHARTMSVTEDTSHELRGWLKEGVSREHALVMSVTEDTSHESRGWLKERATLNMSDMSVTEDTSHESSGLVEGGGADEHA